MSSPADPEGRRALFEAPAQDLPGMGGQSQHIEGRAAFYSGPPRAGRGMVLIECSGCGRRSRTSLADAAARVMRLTLWIPWRAEHNRWIACPACRRRTWCRVHWLG
jgi:hypothetical protein